MSAKKADLAARAANLTTRPTARAAADSPATPPPATPRAEPVRVSLDLAPVAYRSLTGFAADIAASANRARVPHAEVLRSLITALEEQPELQEWVRNDVITRLRK